MEMRYSAPKLEPDPAEKIILALRRDLVGLFQVAKVDAESQGKMISFSGRLTVNADNSYDEIRQRFQVHGYTPLFRQEKGEDVILAMEGLVDQAKTGSPLVNILLLAATVLTTLSFGSQLVLGIDLWQALGAGNINLVAQTLRAGIPYALTLLGILGVHELGHYVAARLHGVQATLPYFIPLPFGLGTLGALIQIKSPMKDRRVLFDIGLAGPYAGLFVAIPLFLIGLSLSSSHIVPASLDARTLERLGSSIFMKIALYFLADVAQGQTLIVDPILFAAWWGIFVTGINLLPVGQLDGGHTSYALFGRYAHPIALITFFLLIVAGALLQQLSWFIWAFFIMLGGLRHRPPMNDISDVGPVRKAIGVITIFVVVLIFVPVPRLIG